MLRTTTTRNTATNVFTYRNPSDTNAPETKKRAMRAGEFVDQDPLQSLLWVDPYRFLLVCLIIH